MDIAACFVAFIVGGGLMIVAALKGSWPMGMMGALLYVPPYYYVVFMRHPF